MIASQLVAKAKAAGLIVGPAFTAYIVNYEAGFVARSAQYSQHTLGDESEGHRAHLKTELADLIVQSRLLAEQHGFDWNELITMGESRLFETAEKFEKLGINTMNMLLGYKPRVERITSRRDGD